MQKIKQKLFFAVNFFKILGFEVEPFDDFRLKVIKLWPFMAYFIHSVVVAILSIYGAFVAFTDESHEFKNAYADILSRLSLNTTVVVGLVFTFTHRKHEKNFWNSLDQLDDFIVRFLDIKVDYKLENWHHLRRIMFIIVLNYSMAATLSLAKFTLSVGFNRHYNSIIYLIFLNQLNMNKYVFYVSIINNRMQILSANFQQISDRDYKVLILPRIYSILWTLTRKLEKRFNWPMLLMMINFFVMSSYFGYLLSFDISRNSSNIVHCCSFLGPQITIWFTCYHCNKIRRTVSILAFLFGLRSYLSSAAT